MGKIGLTCDWAQCREFRRRKSCHVVRPGMRVWHAIKDRLGGGGGNRAPLAELQPFPCHWYLPHGLCTSGCTFGTGHDKRVVDPQSGVDPVEEFPRMSRPCRDQASSAFSASAISSASSLRGNRWP